MKLQKKHIIILVVLCIAAVILLGMMYPKHTSSGVSLTNKNTSATSSPTKSMTRMQMPKMKLSVAFFPEKLVITNKENADWQVCQFELNATIVKKGYMVDQQPLPANQSTTIPLTQFQRDGQKFDPSRSQPRDVMIMCKDTMGMSGWNYFANR